MIREGRSPLVVIVDDDELMRRAVDGLMKQAGFQALTFASAEEFLNSGNKNGPHV
jgi:FixJ family two-component response regulator